MKGRSPVKTETPNGVNYWLHMSHKEAKSIAELISQSCGNLLSASPGEMEPLKTTQVLVDV